MGRKAAKRQIRSFRPRIELPQFRQNTAWLQKLDSFHATVECAFRTLKRFTTADFLVKFRTCNPSEFGYRSLNHLFSFRGCLSEGNYYIYDERSAMTMKACIVATKLGKFSQKEFRDTFEMFFVTKQLLNEGCGFDSLEALLDSIPALVSIGAGEYEMRSGAEVRPIPEERREKDATIATEEEGPLVRNSAETIAENEVGHYYGLPKFDQNKTKEQFAKVLRVARTLKSPFCEKDLHDVYLEYYKVRAFCVHSGERRVPVFLDTIPGIEHIGGGMYRLDERSTGGEEVELVDEWSDGEAERADDSGDEQDDNPVVTYAKEGTERVREKRALLSATDNSDADGGGEQKKKRRRESPPVISDSIVDGARIDHDEMVTVVLEEGSGEVAANEEPAPSAESPTIPTDTTGSNPSPSLYDHILSLGVVRGQWAKDQLTLITGQIEKSIQQQGSMGGTDVDIAESSNPQQTEASSSSVVSPQSVHQAFTNLMGEFNNQFLYHLGVEAIERGVSPAELGKKIMDDFFGKKNQP